MSQILAARSVGTGALGFGGEPSRHRTTPELCVAFFHPPATYNPWLDRTWCLCGDKQWAGNQVRSHVACCDGPLTVLNGGSEVHDEAFCADLVKSRGFCFDIECACSCHHPTDPEPT